jgi:hypothetical protein
MVPRLALGGTATHQTGSRNPSPCYPFACTFGDLPLLTPATPGARGTAPDYLLPRCPLNCRPGDRPLFSRPAALY